MFFVLQGPSLTQLVESFLEGGPLLSFLFLRPLIEFAIKLLRNRYFVQVLEIVTKFRVSAEQVKSIRQLRLRIRELSIMLVRLSEAGEVDSCAKRIPHILVELIWFLSL